MTSRSRSAVFLATITALSSAMSAYAANFSDVSGSPNAIAIQYLSDKGVIGGYPDGTFRPRNTVNRAELAKFLVGGTGATLNIIIVFRMLRPNGSRRLCVMPKHRAGWPVTAMEHFVRRIR